MVVIIGFVLLILGVYGDELLPLNNVTLMSGGTVYYSWDPHRVIDGNNSTNADTCNCCTAISRPAWISLNIGQPYLVTKIEIYGRTDHDTDQSQNMRLCVGLLDEIEEGCRNITNSDTAIVFNPPRLAQFVNITGLNNGTSTGKFMTICEIKIFQQNDYNCTFESDSTCTWTDVTSGDDFDWTLTYGARGIYMYIGTSGSRKTGERAWLISPMLRPTSFTEGCLQFWYNMNGPSIGLLSVYLTAHGEKPGPLLWRISGDQGQEWKGASVNLSSLEQYQVIIEAVVGNSYFGDIAIDDVTILPTACQQEKGLLIG